MDRLNGFLLFSLLLTSPVTATAAVDTGAASRTPPCAYASRNNDVFAAGLGHNSFDGFFRAPFGALRTDQQTMGIRFRACRDDLTRVRIRVWDATAARESWIQLNRESESVDSWLGPVEYWAGNVPVPSYPTLLYYFFEVTDGFDVRYYVDDFADNSLIARGGWGRYSRNWDDLHTYQITVYDKDFRVPDWLKGAVAYQILPDRFRNGDRTNDPREGTGSVFSKPMHFLKWNEPLCDPRSTCLGQSDNQFYGGDLEGVINKLDYLKDLGVKLIYFNPIFQSATNHRYDTQDYFLVDPKLGDMTTFRRLVEETSKRDIHLVLDGVFNHGSADSPYFDVFRRWGGVGACESADSPFRDWFYFPHFMHRPVDHARPGTSYYCQGTSGTLITYEAWWGYFEHPVYNKSHPAVRNFFFADGANSVGPFWLRNGAAGWRLDVASDVGRGQAIEPNNRFWRDFRDAVKNEKRDSILIGEEWGNASPWLLGNEWDSAMNYRFRTALLNWLADGCSGEGCVGGTVFSDDDNSEGSPNGPIVPISESEFDRRLKSIQEDYPPEAWHSMLNLLGSHDTQRVGFILKKTSHNNGAIARSKLRFASLFQYTYPGTPMTYYGDEAGVAAEGKFHDGKWKDDPYTRAVYPWADEGLQPDLELTGHFANLGKLRNSHTALRDGRYETLAADDLKRVFAFRRYNDREEVFVVLNRGHEPSRILVPVNARLIPDGTVLNDVLNGGTFKVTDGNIDCGEVAPLWGRILVSRQR